MPHDLGAFHVIVNVPEFVVRVVENGAVVHETRVVVGKPTNQTPTFSNAISYLIVNPYWNVPTSIVSKEMLPEIQADPYGYFAVRAIRCSPASVAGCGRSIRASSTGNRSIRAPCRSARSPATTMRSAGSSSCFRISIRSICTTRRRSGSSSATVRALSHGCVRVQNPLDFADALLHRAAPTWNSEATSKALWRSGAAGQPGHAGSGASRLLHDVGRCRRHAAPFRRHLRLRQRDGSAVSDVSGRPSDCPSFAVISLPRRNSAIRQILIPG